MNDLETIRELLAATPGRVDVNGRDHNGQSPIEYAVGNAHPEALELLLAAGADPNTRSGTGLPVLHDAAGRRKGERMIPLLLRAGASVKARDRDGHTALAHAVRHKRDQSARVLRSAGVPAT
jgi:ankyrin repeat protein